MPRGQGVPAGLSRQRLRRAVLEVTDEQGLDALTVRNVARHVGVEAMSIYHYFPSKDALVAAAWDEVVCTLEPRELDSEETWLDYGLAFADQLRARLLEHPHALPIMLGRHVSGEDSMAVVEQVVAALHRRGLRLSEAVEVLNLVSMFTMAHALNQHQLPTRQLPTPDPELHPSLHGSLTDTTTPHAGDRFHAQVKALLQTCA